jgi:hypothetical protein
MTETKFGKHIITELKPKKRGGWEPKLKPEESLPVLFLDSSVLKGAFYVETSWTLPPFADETRGESHQHDFDEVLAFFGSDPADPHELHAVAEVHIGGEVHTITKSCLIFVPKGVPHGPIDFKKIDKPIFHFSCSKSNKYL